jgi:hypothetical protein
MCDGGDGDQISCRANGPKEDILIFRYSFGIIIFYHLSHIKHAHRIRYRKYIIIEARKFFASTRYPLEEDSTHSEFLNASNCILWSILVGLDFSEGFDDVLHSNIAEGLRASLVNLSLKAKTLIECN